jgi:transcriptional regulator with XRE-family HTH domain
MIVDLPFAEWLSKELQDRNLSQREFARQTGLQSTAIHKLLTQKSKNPSVQTCEAIARIFRMSVFTVISIAYKIPLDPEMPELEDLKTLLAGLSPDRRETLLVLARALYEHEEKSKTRR